MIPIVADVHPRDTETRLMGGLSELRATIHLLQLGYEVFRAVTDCASCDLIAHREGFLWKIEVRTMSSPREIKYLPSMRWPEKARCDYVMFVGHTHIFTFPVGHDREEARQIVRSTLGLGKVTPPLPIPPPV